MFISLYLYVDLYFLYANWCTLERVALFINIELQILSLYMHTYIHMYVHVGLLWVMLLVRVSDCIVYAKAAISNQNVNYVYSHIYIC